VTPWKDQTWEPWPSKKEKRCKLKGYIIYSKNNSREFAESQERVVHSGTGASKTPNRLAQIEPIHNILSLKQLEQRKNIEGSKRKSTYQGKSIKITADFSTETLKARRIWTEIFHHWKETISVLGYSAHQNYHSQ
jgi:hypothetical protein